MRDSCELINWHIHESCAWRPLPGLATQVCRALYKHIGRNSHQPKESAIQIDKKDEKHREMRKGMLFLRFASAA